MILGPTSASTETLTRPLSSTSMFKVSGGTEFISHVNFPVIKHNRHKEELSPTKGWLQRLIAKRNLQNSSLLGLPLRNDSLVGSGAWATFRCFCPISSALISVPMVNLCSPLSGEAHKKPSGV